MHTHGKWQTTSLCYRYQLTIVSSSFAIKLLQKRVQSHETAYWSTIVDGVSYDGRNWLDGATVDALVISDEYIFC